MNLTLKSIELVLNDELKPFKPIYLTDDAFTCQILKY